MPTFPFLKKPQPPLAVNASAAEVGRSLLGQVVPQHIRGQIPKRYTITAWLPLAITLALGEGYLSAFPTVDGAWWRVLYLWLFGAAWSAALLWRNRWAKQQAGVTREFEYAREQLQPALHCSGVLTSLADTLRVMRGETVAIPHNTNLHHANSMRLVREADGTHAIQFEFV